jgi:hypothetical protein
LAVERSVDKESFASLLQFELNHDRSLRQLTHLKTDPTAQGWVESKMGIAKANTPEAIDSILESIQEAMPTVHAAAAYLTYADDEPQLIDQIANWHREVGLQATHLSTVPFIDSNPQISYGGVGTNITANFCGRFIDSPPLFPL